MPLFAEGGVGGKKWTADGKESADFEQEKTERTEINELAES
jgi:hypothetical protein